MQSNPSFNYIIIYLTPGIVILIILLSPVIVLAIDYNAEANSLSSPGLSSFNSGAVDNVPGYEGTNIKEANYYNDSAAMEDDSIHRQRDDEAGQTVSSNFANQGDWQFNFKNDPMFASEQADFDPYSYVDWLTGEYTDCDPESGSDIIINDTQTCDQYLASQENACQIPRVVEVDSNYNYSCTKELSYTTKNCTQNLNVTVNKEPLSASNFGTYYLKPVNWPYNLQSWVGSYQSSGSRLIVTAVGFQYGCTNKLSPVTAGDKLYLTSTGYGSNPSFNGIYTVKSTSFRCYRARLLSGYPYFNETTISLEEGFNSNINNSVFYIKKQTSEPPVTSITSTWGSEICS